MQEKAGLLYRQVKSRKGAQLRPANGPCIILTGNVVLPRTSGFIKLYSQREYLLIIIVIF